MKAHEIILNALLYVWEMIKAANTGISNVMGMPEWVIPTVIAAIITGYILYKVIKQKLENL